MALTRPYTLDRPFTRWSLTKLADYMVEAGVVDDISTTSIRRILDEEGISFQRLRTWKESNDPHYEEKKELIWALVHDPPPGYRIISVDEFGPITCEHGGAEDGPRTLTLGDEEPTTASSKESPIGSGSTTSPATNSTDCSLAANASLTFSVSSA